MKDFRILGKRPALTLSWIKFGIGNIKRQRYNAGSSMNKNDVLFKSLVDEYLEELWKYSPIQATFAGIHKYDGCLDKIDFQSRSEFINKISNWLNRLDKLETEGGLNNDNLLDLAILKANLKKDFVAEQSFNRYINDPSLYPGTIIFACLILLMRDFAPREERFRSLISRLNGIPEYLEAASENLSSAWSIPLLWYNMAFELIPSGQRFFARIISHHSGEIPSLKDEMMAAAILASKAFDRYHQFLENKLAGKASGTFACGQEYFNFLLREYHLLPYDSNELEIIGRKYINSTLKEMRQIADEIDPRKDMYALIDEIKADSPAPEELLDFYRSEMFRTREFIINRDLVTLPPDEILEIIETPDSERSTFPYAGYMSPAPFEENLHGLFWVTPIDIAATDERIREQLAGHSRAAIEIRSLHEGYPGHHLQLCLANRLPSKIRRLLGTSVFAEGWALYCENLMKKMGYYSGKRTELIQLKDQLWRACRIVIDVRLHTGTFSFADSVDMLVNVARLERSNAEAEVRRYSQDPTQPMSYLIGKMELENILADYTKQNPGRSLKEFHDRLLSYGTIPFGLIRNELLGTKNKSNC
jgi:uncharacterized protein (DUF885 family)